MKSYESRNAVALRKRVKKVHAKAKFVGVLYFLGTLAMALLACLPMLHIGEQDLWVTTFFAPILALFGPDSNLLAGITSILYLIIFLTCIINFFKCFGKLGWLTKRSTRYVNGYNRNMRAMEAMGKYFSRAFSALINGYLLIYVLQPTENNVALTGMYPYVTLAAGLAIHFLAGLIGGKVSFFNVGGPHNDVEEEPRAVGLFVYFFRNLVQVAATAGIIYYFVPVSTINVFVNALLTGGDFMADIIPNALQLLTLIWIFVLVKHATNITEFNRFGIDGAGMKNYRIFSFLTMLTCGGLFALTYMAMEVPAIEGTALSYLTIVGIAFLAFLVDCIFKSRVKEDKEIMDEEYYEKPQKQQRAVARPQAIPVQPQVPNAQSPTQPIYVPVYYPMPMAQPVPQPAPMPYPCAPQRPVRPAPCPQPARPMPCMVPPCMQQAPGAACPQAQRPMGMPPAMPAPAPVAAPTAAPETAPVEKAAPVAPSQPVEPAKSAPTCPMVRPEPSPAPAHLQPKACPLSDKPKTKKELRQEKKEEKARAKFLKQSQKSAKKAKKLTKELAKAEKKQEKKNKTLNKKAKSEPVAPVQTPVTNATAVSSVSQAPVDQAPVKESIPFNTDPVEVEMPIDPKKQWKIRCPQCGKELSVRETSPYHRCPSCDKVFSLRKFEAYVKKS